MKALAVVLAVLLAGCSLRMDTVAKGWEPAGGEPKCDASLTRPVLDFVVAATFVMFSLASFDEYSSCEPEFVNDCDERLEGVVGFAVISIPWVVDGVFGLRKRSKCREAKREYAQWQELSPEELQCRRAVRKWREVDSPAVRWDLWGRMPEKCRLTVPKAELDQREARTLEAEWERQSRAVEAERKRQGLAPGCYRPIDQWRQEKDFVKKTKLYNRMREDCRKSITRTKEDPTGEEHFERAQRAEADGEYVVAQTEYIAAYNKLKDPRIFYYLARAYEADGKAKPAVAYYRRYLREVEVPKQHRKEVRAKIDALEQPPIDPPARKPAAEDENRTVEPPKGR